MARDYKNYGIYHTWMIITVAQERMRIIVYCFNSNKRVKSVLLPMKFMQTSTCHIKSILFYYHH